LTRCVRAGRPFDRALRGAAPRRARARGPCRLPWKPPPGPGSGFTPPPATHFALLMAERTLPLCRTTPLPSASSASASASPIAATAAGSKFWKASRYASRFLRMVALRRGGGGLLGGVLLCLGRGFALLVRPAQTLVYGARPTPAQPRPDSHNGQASPAQPCLRALEHQQLKQRAVVPLRAPPLGVVVTAGGRFFAFVARPGGFGLQTQPPPATARARGAGVRGSKHAAGPRAAGAAQRCKNPPENAHPETLAPQKSKPDSPGSKTPNPLTLYTPERRPPRRRRSRGSWMVGVMAGERRSPGRV
jgi:hypothetical protein